MRVGHGVHGISRTYPNDETNKIEKPDKAESEIKGPTTESTDSAEASD